MAEWQRWKDIMKCYPFEEKRLAKWKPPYIVQPKYDGNRCWGERLQNGNWILTSSGGHMFFSVPHILEALDNSPLKDVVIDGELYDHSTYLRGGHELIHGIVSRTVKLHPSHRLIKLHLFDIKDPSKDQLARLIELEKIKDLDIPYIEISPFWICHTLDDIKRTYDHVIELGYEGIIVRHHAADYREKRSIYVMKFKPKRYDDYTIVGYNEEHSMDGVPKGRLGSLIMSSQDGDTFAVSAGLSHDDRERLWEVRGLLSGTSARVHYQHLTSNKIPKGSFKIEIPDFGI